MLAAWLEQLNGYGVEVLWSQGIRWPFVWISDHSLLILKASADGLVLAACCTRVLSEVSETHRCLGDPAA